MLPVYKKISQLALVFAISATLSSCNKKEAPQERKPQKVKAVEIGQLQKVSTRSFPGQSRPSEEATLSFRVSGKIVERKVDVGTQVKKGDIIAVLDQTNFSNSLDIAKAKLNESAAAFEDANADYKRTLSVMQKDPGAISPKAVDRAKATSAVLKASLEAAKAAVRVTETKLSHTILKAPFDGEIVKTFKENSETIIAKQPIVKIVSFDKAEFTIDVPENLIYYTKDVTSCFVTFDIKPELKFEASIKEIGREASISTRTYPVTLSLKKQEKLKILTGMAGNAVFKAQAKDLTGTGHEIAASSLFTDSANTKNYVWIIKEDKTLEKRLVEIGMPRNKKILILKGLNPGDWVVTAGVHLLSEGQEVRILNSSVEGKLL